MDHFIVGTIAFVLILVFSLQFILLGIPFFQRMTFDALCHQALMKMDQAGGMTLLIQGQLESDLIARGFLDPVIHGDWNVPYGNEIGLFVEVTLNTRLIQSNLHQVAQLRHFIFENSIVSRQILTDADLA
ncbi:MAG: hypothetical protein PHC86_08430 [Eubacteriales bacterium]|nr:hypothetical protein [Eubacteriales bacterium]